MTTAGDAEAQTGMASHVLIVTKSMEREHFFNADGEMLIVAQQNKMRFRTEFGVIEIEPGEICVIPRGVIFRVELINGPARGYVCENYGGAFKLPDRGPIGANCLANARDFLAPVAAYEDVEKPCTLYVKWGGELFRTKVPHSPLDVAAWHGNYYPYKYDMRRFSPVGALLFDHPDPSIYTVMTSPSETPGTANVDFVIFPERWAVAENTFRPPWYHRNIMSEFMGLVYGVYDAKPEGFVPGGMSLHNQMLPHGPDSDAFEQRQQRRIEAGEAHQHARLHVRDALSPAHHPIRRRASDPPGRLHGLLEGPEEAFQSQATETEMKLASLKGGRDGRLVVVSRDLTRAADASAVAPTLRDALDDWAAAEPRLAGDRRIRSKPAASPTCRSIRRNAPRRCRAASAGPTARPTSITWRWFANRAAPRCRRRSGPIR